MLKFITVMLVLIACCHCLDNEALPEDSRASKKKKNAMKLWAMLLIFALSKVAVFKVASFMFFYMIFQKLFYFAGIFLNYYMKTRAEKPSAPSGPPAMYGPPGPPSADYNTIGYSYGPPESNADVSFPGPEYGLPSLSDVGGSFNNWLFNKNP